MDGYFQRMCNLNLHIAFIHVGPIYLQDNMLTWSCCAHCTYPSFEKNIILNYLGPWWLLYLISFLGYFESLLVSQFFSLGYFNYLMHVNCISDLKITSKARVNYEMWSLFYFWILYLRYICKLSTKITQFLILIICKFLYILIFGFIKHSINFGKKKTLNKYKRVYLKKFEKLYINF